MTPITKKGMLLCMAFSTAAIQSCAITSTGSRHDFAIPGCENAWNTMVQAKALKELRTVVTNDCANLYQSQWRLPMNKNRSGNHDPDVCNPAWNSLKEKKQLDNVKFMITHNCPVFYRKGWIIPPR